MSNDAFKMNDPVYCNKLWSIKRNPVRYTTTHLSTTLLAKYRLIKEGLFNDSNLKSLCSIGRNGFKKLKDLYDVTTD